MCMLGILQTGCNVILLMDINYYNVHISKIAICDVMYSFYYVLHCIVWVHIDIHRVQLTSVCPS